MQISNNSSFKLSHALALSATIHLTAAAIALLFNGSQSSSPGQQIQRAFHDNTKNLAVVLLPRPKKEPSPPNSQDRQFLSDERDATSVPSHQTPSAPSSRALPQPQQNDSNATASSSRALTQPQQNDPNAAASSEHGAGPTANLGENDVAPPGIVLPAFIEQTPIPLDHSSLSSFDGKATALATIVVDPQGKALTVKLAYDGDPLPDEFKEILYQSLMQTDYAPALVNGLPSQGTLTVVIDIAPPPKAQLLEKKEIFTRSGPAAR